MEPIEKERARINDIDEQLVELLNERARVAMRIGEIKQEAGIGVVDPTREARVIARVRELTSAVSPEMVEAIWREVMAACKNVQGRVVKIGYLGPAGSFTELAAYRYFPKAGSQFVALDNIQRVFDEIEKGRADFGVVPIENSLQGSVRETMDHLIEKPVKIYGEQQIRVVHNLVGCVGTTLDEVTDMYSHPQGLEQCRAWLRKNMPNAALHETKSTAEAVRLVLFKQNPRNAAIGTALAAQIYDGEVLVEGIEDNPNNYTRFLVLSKQENLPTGNDKTSIVFVTKHVPGALLRVLSAFASHDINLLKIESRPQKTNVWEYTFWEDFEGHVDNARVQEALDEAREHTIWLKVLGSYPRTETKPRV